MRSSSLLEPYRMELQRVHVRLDPVPDPEECRKRRVGSRSRHDVVRRAILPHLDLRFDFQGRLAGTDQAVLNGERQLLTRTEGHRARWSRSAQAVREAADGFASRRRRKCGPQHPKESACGGRDTSCRHRDMDGCPAAGTAGKAATGAENATRAAAHAVPTRKHSAIVTSTSPKFHSNSPMTRKPQ